MSWGGQTFVAHIIVDTPKSFIFSIKYNFYYRINQKMYFLIDKWRKISMHQRDASCGYGMKKLWGIIVLW